MSGCAMSTTSWHNAGALDDLFGLARERLCEQRARFQDSGDTQIVKRFMVETLRFRGIRNAVDAVRPASEELRRTRVSGR